MSIIITNMEMPSRCISFERKYQGEECPFLKHLKSGNYCCAVLRGEVINPYLKCEAIRKDIIIEYEED